MYSHITNVEVRRVQYSKKELYVHQEEGDPVVLYHFEIRIDLEEAKNLILKYKDELSLSN